MADNAVVSNISRLFFLGAFAAFALALAERLAQALGYTILRDVTSASRLLEVAAVLLIFVIALLLREVREELRRR